MTTTLPRLLVIGAQVRIDANARYHANRVGKIVDIDRDRPRSYLVRFGGEHGTWFSKDEFMIFQTREV